MEGTYERITSSDRARIEEMINECKSLAEIARELGRDATSVSREVRRNRVERGKVSKSKFMRNPCAKRESCAKRNLCRAKGCTRPCSKCERVFCHDRCPDFVPWECDRLKRWPHVCNRCRELSTCPELRFVYDGARAHRIASSRASLSRRGLGVGVADLERIDGIVSPLLEKGQSPYHIWVNHRFELEVCLSTLYAYVNAGILSAGRMRLARAVGFRKRRKEGKAIRDKRDFGGRTYSDYVRAMEAIQDEL